MPGPMLYETCSGPGDADFVDLGFLDISEAPQRGRGLRGPVRPVGLNRGPGGRPAMSSDFFVHGGARVEHPSGAGAARR